MEHKGQPDEYWGITYKCKKCGILVRFPKTPNAEIDDGERLAHAIYTAKANEGLCKLDCIGND